MLRDLAGLDRSTVVLLAIVAAMSFALGLIVGSVTCDRRRRPSARALGAALLALGALWGPPADAAAYVYTGSIGSVSHANGVMGFGSWLAMGAPDLGDSDDSTGVLYAQVPDVYGHPTTGAFSVRPFDDGRVPLGAVVTGVTMRVRVRATSTFTEFQTFSHLDVDEYQHRHMIMRSQPWAHQYEQPYFGAPWVQSSWTWVSAVFDSNPLALSFDGWSRGMVFACSFGVMVQVPLGEYAYLSEWELTIYTL